MKKIQKDRILEFRDFAYEDQEVYISPVIMEGYEEIISEPSTVVKSIYKIGSATKGVLIGTVYIFAYIVNTILGLSK